MSSQLKGYYFNYTDGGLTPSLYTSDSLERVNLPKVGDMIRVFSWYTNYTRVLNAWLFAMSFTGIGDFYFQYRNEDQSYADFLHDRSDIISMTIYTTMSLENHSRVLSNIMQKMNETSKNRYFSQSDYEMYAVERMQRFLDDENV